MMSPFYGVFLDKDGNEHDLTELNGGSKKDPLIDEKVLSGVFGSGVFDLAQVTVTNFGTANTATGKYIW